MGDNVHSWCEKCKGEIRVDEAYYAITANKEKFTDGNVVVKGSALLYDYCLSCGDKMMEFAQVRDDLVIENYVSTVVEDSEGSSLP